MIVAWFAVVTPTFAHAIGIAEQKGVAVYQVDAEAGLHPESPRRDDQKVVSIEGHAYWLRPSPPWASSS
jgi:hypothetical protein